MIHLDPVWQADCQRAVFRELLQAFSYPGRVVDLSPSMGENRAELAILAALLDNTTTFCDLHCRLATSEVGLLGAIPAAVSEAAFVLLDAAIAPPDDFQPCLGTIYRPEGGATLVLSGHEIGSGPSSLEIRGPGVLATCSLAIDGFDPRWFERRERWVAGFPVGVDLVLCDRRRAAAIPRTSSVAWAPSIPTAHAAAKERAWAM